MIGDWYDTLQHPGSSGPNIASLVRWVASDYNTIDEMALREGKIEYESSQIFHCHILSHEGKYDTIDVLVIGTVLYLIYIYGGSRSLIPPGTQTVYYYLLNIRRFLRSLLLLLLLLFKITLIQIRECRDKIFWWVQRERYGMVPPTV